MSTNTFDIGGIAGTFNVFVCTTLPSTNNSAEYSNLLASVNKYSFVISILLLTILN